MLMVGIMLRILIPSQEFVVSINVEIFVEGGSGHVHVFSSRRYLTYLDGLYQSYGKRNREMMEGF